MRSLLRPEAMARLTQAPYRFCATPRCDTVYYPEGGGGTFSRADLTVRVGIKETDPPRPICYCFDHTREEIEDEVRRTGTTRVPGDIQARIRVACWCETRNPAGTCCLGTVNRVAREALVRHAGSGSVGPSGAPPGAGIKRPGEPAKKLDAQRLAQIGTLASAVIASACCWLPLFLVAFGVSGVAVSATFERYRPLFMGLTFAFLAAAFYLTYRPRRPAGRAGSAGEACCAVPDGEHGAAPAEACCPPEQVEGLSVRRLNRVLLWVVTAVALGFAFFPDYAGLVLGGGTTLAPSAGLEQIVVSIEGMTCEACAAQVQAKLARVPGVRSAAVSYSEGRAVIHADPPVSDAALRRAVEAAGYTVRSMSHRAASKRSDGGVVERRPYKEASR